VCLPKHVEQLTNIGIINSTTRLHLVGSFYEFYITMHGSMNIMSQFHIFPPKAALGLHWNWLQAAVLTAAHNHGIAGWSAIAYNVLGSEGARERGSYLPTVYTREVNWRLVHLPSNQELRYCWLSNLLPQTIIYFCHASSCFLSGKSVWYYALLFSRCLTRFSF